MHRRRFLTSSLAISALALGSKALAGPRPWPHGRSYKFSRTISREVLQNYLSRAVSMEGLLNGRGDFADNVRMLRHIGAKYIGRSICLWGGEAKLLDNFERARRQRPQVHAADRDMILEACIFEIVTTQVEQVPVPDWAFIALGLPPEERNFRYDAMLYPLPQRTRSWGTNGGVPDVSQTETQLWFYFLAASYIDLGFEGLHWGQMEIMNRNDRQLDHYARLFGLVRAYAEKHARRGMVLGNAHVPSGGLVRDGQLLLDFHAFPLRVKEVPDRPQEGVLEVGHRDSIVLHSKGGRTASGWACDHVPYLVELDNYGVSRQPGQAGQGGDWIWGYDEISWFANQTREYRSAWLRYAWAWLRKTDPNGFLQMPGSRTETSPLNNRRWYYANSPSTAVPDGLGDEEAIRAIWKTDRI
ncbi:MAG TPA: hypothetical protein VEL79_06915 [Vicinamibacterales bacterium]|nr:hypothetical protein [Vicinamibacterales bacterium]